MYKKTKFSIIAILPITFDASACAEQYLLVRVSNNTKNLVQLTRNVRGASLVLSSSGVIETLNDRWQTQ